MSLPELLSGTVGDEAVVARVPLGGDDLLAVTPTRTLVYRADGLLSDESVEEYGHDVERIDVSTGRRKSKIVLSYGLDGDETLSLPTNRVDDVLHPLLAGVLSATGVTGPGESVRRTFRFSELTLVVTDQRLVKHVGSAVWDEEFEEFPYANLTDLDFEEGTVATAVVLTHDGRSERFKAPNESARAVRETLVDAVCAFHGVDSVEEFRVTVAVDDGDDGAETAGEAESGTGTTDFGDGPDPLSASPAADAEAQAEPSPGPGSGTPSNDEGRDDAVDGNPPPDDSVTTEAVASTESATNVSTTDTSTTDMSVADDSSSGEPAAPDPLDDEFGVDASVESGAESGVGADSGVESEPGERTEPGSTETDPLDGTTGTKVDAPENAAEPDAFEESPFESVGVEDDDLAAEVASLRAAVEAQSERLERQSELIERLIEELRRGR